MVNGVFDAANNVMPDMMPVRHQARRDVIIRNNVTRIVNHCSSNAAPFGGL
jgi:hypothetical protein